jgi:protein-disulfide isomerase
LLLKKLPSLVCLPAIWLLVAGFAFAENSPSLSPELLHRIQSEIRAYYNIPARVNISVSNPSASDMAGFDAISVTFTGGPQVVTYQFLLSKDRKTLAHLKTFDLSQDFMSKIDLNGRPVRGNANAKVTIVNFDDFECPFCARMYTTLFNGMLKSYGDKIKIVYKDYPLTQIHPWAMHAAVDANCLAEQSSAAYWDFSDYVHANQREIGGKSRQESFTNLDSLTAQQGKKYNVDVPKLDACVKKQDESKVRASMAEADKLNVEATPTLFVNGERISGAIPEAELREVLDRVLADNK